MTIVPAPRPCGSCPYRRDVPSGVWSQEEYEKLPPFDAVTTAYQPPSAFFCHQQDGRLCAGWVATHDMAESFGLRLLAALGKASIEEINAVLDYETDVPLFSSGAEAAEHGMRDIEEPGIPARLAVDRLRRKQRRKEGSMIHDPLIVDRRCDVCQELLGDKPKAEVFMPDEVLDKGQEHTVLLIHQSCFDPATMEVA